MQSSQALSQEATPTPPQSLASAKLISSGIVSYKISRLADNKNDGEMSFGGVDGSKFDSSTYVTVKNVNTNGFWEVNVDGIQADGKDLNLNGRTAVLDTGTVSSLSTSAANS